MTKRFTEEDLRASIASYMRIAAGLADSSDVSEERKDKVRSYGFALVEQGYNLLTMADAAIGSEDQKSVIYSLIDDLMRSAFELGGEAIVTADQEVWVPRRHAAKLRERKNKINEENEAYLRGVIEQTISSFSMDTRTKRGFASLVLDRVNKTLTFDGRDPVQIGVVRRRLATVRS